MLTTHTHLWDVHAQGSIRDKVGQPSETGQIGIVDPQCRMIGMHAYNGLFKVLPMDTRGNLQEPFDVRLDLPMVVIDMVFLHGSQNSTVATLYEHRDARHVRTDAISLRDKCLQPGPWAQENVERGACRLVAIPEPLMGLLIIGQQTVTYHCGRYFKVVARCVWV